MFAPMLALCALGAASHGCQPRPSSLPAQEASDWLWVKPYLQDPRPDAMTIHWWTNERRPESHVEYGKEQLDKRAAATSRYVAEMGKWSHEASLTGLEPATAYTYRVRSGDRASERYTLHTAKDRRSDLLISLLGDGRTDDAAVIARHRKLFEMAAGSDLIFELGDEVYEGSAEQWDRFLRQILTSSDPANPGSTTGSRVPCQLVVGNHEIAYLPAGQGGEDPKTEAYYHSPYVFESIRRYKAIVSNPPNGSSNTDWEERYYSIRYGAVTFIVLDANDTSNEKLRNNDYLAPGTTPDWQPGSEQYRWMVAELERARAESAFTFVLAHPSPYSPGIHGTPSHVEDAQRGYELRVLDPVFRAYGVDAVITSHDHLATRSLVGPPGFEEKMDDDDPNNLNYLVMGNSGQSGRGKAPGWEQWMSVRGDGKAPFYTRWFYTWEGQDERSSFVRLRVVRNDDGTWTASFSVVRDDGKIFDPFSIRREDPKPAQLRPSQAPAPG